MALRWNDAERTLALGIRDLSDLGRRHIDRARGEARLAMSGTGRMARGSALHRREQAGRAGPWASEVPLRWTQVVREWTCTVHGRVDGIVEEDGRTVIEELKSTALDAAALDAVAGFPEWEEQLALYVLFAAEARMPDPVGILRVVSLIDGAQRVWTIPARPELADAARRRLDRVVREREAYLHWQGVRGAAPVVFPHDAAREGQAAMIDAARLAVEEGGHLLLSAPTGLGKTAAVLAGVLTAAAKKGVGVYWATARTTQQLQAERTLRAIAAAGTPLRAVTLRAKEKVCLAKADGGAVDCRPEACRYAEGYYERVGDGVIDALAALPAPTATEVEALARAHVLCPYELAVDHGLACDVVVGDYNQCFDPSTQLHRLFGEREWVLVVDEAHQLADRIVAAMSPALPIALAAAARDDALARGWDALAALAAEIHDELEESGLRMRTADEEGYDGQHDGDASDGQDLGRAWSGELPVELSAARWADLAERVDEVAFDHARLRDRPERASPADPAQLSLLAPSAPAAPAVPDADASGSADAADPLDPDEIAEDPWLAFARAVHRFSAALSRAGEETVALWSPAGLRLVCRDPSPVLGPRFAEAHASVLLSATLAPTWFVRDRCGLAPERVRTLDVPSPFPPENRQVVVVPGVSTAYRHRERDRAKIAEILHKTVAAVPGNAVVYFASYEMLRAFDTRVGEWGRPSLLQAPDATDAERAEILAALELPGQRVLLAVLGGAFAEGVDIPPHALSAVIVVGPALPPPSVERTLYQQWFEQRYDAGFELAWIQPGMTRVVQAAGRVVRGEVDRGVVVLVGQRFLRHEYAQYLPEHWNVAKSTRPWEVVEAFFRGDPPPGA